jgi:tRNA(adenine34) deaminase
MDHEYFMKRALEEATQALKTGEFPVGCVLAYDDRVLVTGSRHNSTPDNYNELDHAEMAALRRLADLGPDVDKEKIVVFSTLEPCLMCYSALIVNGIRNLVYAFEDVMGGGTRLDLASLNPLYSEMKMEISAGVLRKESLALLKAFFSDPRNDYLKGTLLEQHALKA